MTRNSLVKNLRWAGIVLSLIGIIFVVLNIGKYADQFGSLRPSKSQFLALILMVLAYACANLPLAAAWRNLLAHCGSRKSFRWVVRIFGISQLAKYVPGNIMHLAGRQAMGMSAGADTVDMAKSAAWELGTIALSAALFATLLLPWWFESLNSGYAAGLFLIALTAVGLGVGKGTSMLVMRAIIYYAIFFLISGCIFVAITVMFASGGDDFMVLGPGIIGAYVVAWLAGFATPGAPAGVGVREVVLFGLLQSVISHADLLVAILLSRVVTTGGDLVFYFFANFVHDDR